MFVKCSCCTPCTAVPYSSIQGDQHALDILQLTASDVFDLTPRHLEMSSEQLQITGTYKSRVSKAALPIAAL